MGNLVLGAGERFAAYVAAEPGVSLAAMRAPRNVRVTVDLSAEQVAAVRERVRRDRALATLDDLYRRRGVTLRPEHHRWARRALGVDLTVRPGDAPAT